MIAILSILAGIVVAWVSNYVQKSQEAQCLANRTIIEKADSVYSATHDSATTSVAELVGAGLIASEPVCRAGGTYYWATSGSRRILCTVHGDGQSVVTPLTPLGSTFAEISDGMIQRLEAFYAANNHYARTFGDFVYTDIGLNPADWQNPISHIKYSPGGNRFSIRPEAGYQFTVTNKVTGNTMIMKDSYSWYLTYNLADKTWYYHTFLPENAIDITTLQVVKY